MKTKKSANSVALASGQDLSQGSANEGKDRHFFTKILIIMSTVFILLGFLLTHEKAEKKAIFDAIQAEYIEEPALAEVYSVSKILDSQGGDVNFLTVSNALFSGEEGIVKQRVKILKEYLVKLNDINKAASDKEVQEHTRDLLISISTDYTGNPLCATDAKSLVLITKTEFVKRKSYEILQQYQERAKTGTKEEYADELSARLKALNALILDDSWRKYCVDLVALSREPDEVALISRKNQDYFYRGNIYLVSGMAGTMKSYFCLTIAASAINGGVNSDNTLSFYALSGLHKVLYADTELANNTIKKRWHPLWEMTQERFDPDRFIYLSLRRVPGTIEDKKHVFFQACRQYKPDLIVIDSGRDLCLDFNDNREADTLVAEFKQLTTELNAVLICTSHKALSGNNAKGHFGVRFSEAAGMEMSLQLRPDAPEKHVEISFPKQREDVYEPFCMRFVQERGLLEEYSPLVDHTEERRQLRSARLALSSALRPGDRIGHNELVSLLVANARGATGKPISESTAKSYIKEAMGKVIQKDENGKYSLIAESPAITFPADDEDLPPD